jgi:anti-sigma factor RsiW
VARDIGRSSLDMSNLGAQQFANILGTTPMAPLANYEFTPQQIASLRGGERGAQQQALLGVAGMPSATGVAGQAFGSLGSGLTNLGFAQLGAQTRANAGVGGDWDYSTGMPRGYGRQGLG